MALPVTISNSDLLDSGPLSAGPFKSSGGNFYCVLWNNAGGGTIGVFKATDPTSSFSVQDQANDPAVTGYTNIWAYQNGDTIHIVTQENNSALDASVLYHTFSMATDTWGTKDELIETPKDLPTGNPGCSMAMRSDGDIIVCYL